MSLNPFSGPKVSLSKYYQWISVPQKITRHYPWTLLHKPQDQGGFGQERTDWEAYTVIWDSAFYKERTLVKQIDLIPSIEQNKPTGWWMFFITIVKFVFIYLFIYLLLFKWRQAQSFKNKSRSGYYAIKELLIWYRGDIRALLYNWSIERITVLLYCLKQF